jgi:hypothetical protein
VEKRNWVPPALSFVTKAFVADEPPNALCAALTVGKFDESVLPVM